MMRYFIFIFTFVSSTCLAQGTKTLNPNPPYVYKDFKYDKVVVYKCKSNNDGGIVMNDKLKTKIIKGEKTLDKAETDSMHVILRSCTRTTEALTKEESKDHWSPYFGVVYYLKDSIVADYSISYAPKFMFYYRVLREPNDWPNNKFAIDKKTHAKIDAWYAALGIKSDN